MPGMPRRLLRTGLQLGALASAFFIFVLFLDSRYRVLPTSIHSHLPTHHPGLVITDITLKTCSSINPLSTCMLNPDEWHRIEKDLFLSKAWVSSAYVHIKRKGEQELQTGDKVVVDVRISKLDPAMGESSQTGEKWESRPGGIWIKRSQKHDSDSKSVVSAVDVLFGADVREPRSGWLLRENALIIDKPLDEPEARLSIRKGQPDDVEKPVLRINKHGKFKILQVSDLHLSTGIGHCRNAEPPGHNGGKCDADIRTLEFAAKMMDEEQPDMVVFSGDQVNGETAPDAQSAIFKFADLCIKRKIPYATIYGNHDDEGSLSRKAMMSLTESLPYSVSEAGSNTIDGVGNYFVEVYAHSSKHSAMTLWFLDSHGYSPDESKFKGYDWIKPRQIKWFEDSAKSLKESDSHKDYHLIRANMAFIHIPLPEYRTEGPGTPDAEIQGWKEGETKETQTAPQFNSHFRDSLVKEGVSVVSCGHDHVNSYCALSKNKDVSGNKHPALWMCYAGGSGFGGYGGGTWGSFHRRVRVFEFDTNSGRITTWKRLECCDRDTEEKKDVGILVDAGKPVSLHGSH